MKKTLLIFLTFGCLGGYAQSTNVYAYTSKAVTFDTDFNLPIKQSAYKYGYGGSFRVEIPVTEEISVTGLGGVTRLFFKNGLSNKTADVYLPVKAGARYFFDTSLYGDLDLGVALGTDGNPNAFAYGFGLGGLVRIGKQSGLDIGLGGQKWGKLVLRAYLLRVGYRFD